MRVAKTFAQLGTLAAGLSFAKMDIARMMYAPLVAELPIQDLRIVPPVRMTIFSAWKEMKESITDGFAFRREKTYDLVK